MFSGLGLADYGSWEFNAEFSSTRRKYRVESIDNPLAPQWRYEFIFNVDVTMNYNMGGGGSGLSFGMSNSLNGGYSIGSGSVGGGSNPSLDQEQGSRSPNNSLNDQTVNNEYVGDFGLSENTNTQFQSSDLKFNQNSNVNIDIEIDYDQISRSLIFLSTNIGYGELVLGNNKIWLGQNYALYSSSWGGNGYTLGKYKFTTPVYRNLYHGGRVLGVASGLITTAQYLSGDIDEGEALVDITMTVVSFTNPVGFGVATTYYVLKYYGLFEPIYSSQEYIYRNYQRSSFEPVSTSTYILDMNFGGR